MMEKICKLCKNDVIYCKGLCNKCYWHERYTKDPVFREKRKKYNRERYAKDPEFREKLKEYTRKRYAENPEVRKKQKEYSRERSRERWAKDPKYREKRREDINKYYRKKVCRIIQDHDKDLAHDPERLSPTFLRELIMITDCPEQEDE